MKSSMQDFIGRMQVPAKKLGVSELRDREETWRALWSWIPDDVKFLLYRIGSTVRVIKRNWIGSVGELGEVKFDPREYELSVYEKKYNESDGKFYLERKIIKIPAGAVMMLEFITESQLAEEADVPEVMGVESLVEGE